MGRKLAVLFDVDGTLADVTHRRHHLEQEPRDWDSWNAKMGEDKLKATVAGMYDIFANKSHIDVMIVTGRFERYRRTTEFWMNRYNLNKHTRMYMRGDGDYRSDWQVKFDFLQHIRKTHDVMLVLDDRDSVVQMWRDNGCECFQVAPGNF